MKAFFKLLLIAVFPFMGIFTVSAQQSKDYYKFDDNGVVHEFRLTLPDTTIINYNHHAETPFVDGDYATIVYQDGTIIDFSDSHFNGSFITLNGFTSINEWYKTVRKASSAPTGFDLIKNVFNLSYYTIIYPDNSQISIISDKDPEYVKIDNYSDCDDRENCVHWKGNDLLSIKWSETNIPIFNLASNEPTMTECIVSGSYKEYDYNDPYIFNTEEGQIVNKDGELFVGTFTVITNYNEHSAKLRSPYLNELLKNRRSPYTFDDIIGIMYCNGNVVNKENKIVAMYRNCEKLDDFDMESVLVAEQGKTDKAREEAEKAAKERNVIISKYGEKYAKAFFAGEVIVGMPWELVQLGLNAHSFKGFYSALLSIDRRSSYGKTQCYSLYADNFAHVGNMWVRNNVIESITFY